MPSPGSFSMMLTWMQALGFVGSIKTVCRSTRQFSKSQRRPYQGAGGPVVWSYVKLLFSLRIIMSLVKLTILSMFSG